MKRICALIMISLFLGVSGYANEIGYNGYCGSGYCGSEGCGNFCSGSFCCCDNNCCRFCVAAEWLYMLSAIDQPYYSIKAGSGASLFSGNRVANEQHWHSAYRIDFAYYLPCCDYLRVRWTDFGNFSNSDTVNEPNFAILVFPINATTLNSSASIHDKFRFHYLDVVYGRTLYCKCCFNIGIEAGIQYAKLQMKETARYAVGTPIITTFRSNLNAIGPEIAFLFDYSFGRCFSIVARSASALLISKKDAHFKHIGLVGEIGQGLVAQTKNDEYYFATPLLNIRVGLNYNTMLNWLSCFCGCFGIELEVGYEFIHLFKGADRIYFVDNSATGQSFTQQMDWTLHGPYARLGICF